MASRAKASRAHPCCRLTCETAGLRMHDAKIEHGPLGGSEFGVHLCMYNTKQMIRLRQGHNLVKTTCGKKLQHPESSEDESDGQRVVITSSRSEIFLRYRLESTEEMVNATERHARVTPVEGALQVLDCFG